MIPDSAVVLDGLLWSSLIGGLLCLAMSIAFVGRKFTLLEYQNARGINGTNRIHILMNIRTHSMRFIVGVTMALIAILLLADTPMIVRQWVNRILFNVLPWGYLCVSVIDWLAEREQLRNWIAAEVAQIAARTQAAKDDEARRSTQLQADLKDYQEMADEAVRNLKAAAALAREARGERPMPAMAPVVPEHQSPVTPEQQATADKATMRASLTESTLDLGLPPRETQPAPARPPAISPVIGQSLGDMERAASETLEAAEKTVAAAETAVEAIEDERAGREGP